MVGKKTIGKPSNGWLKAGRVGADATLYLGNQVIYRGTFGECLGRLPFGSRPVKDLSGCRDRYVRFTSHHEIVRG